MVLFLGSVLIVCECEQERETERLRRQKPADRARAAKVWRAGRDTRHAYAFIVLPRSRSTHRLRPNY
jgi:hypothetical protein